jgi:hypothetical protein
MLVDIIAAINQATMTKLNLFMVPALPSSGRFEMVRGARLQIVVTAQFQIRTLRARCRRHAG